MSKTELREVTTQIEAVLDRIGEAIERGEAEGTVSETARELWEVVEAIENVLRTIDADALPDAVDLEELPDLVEVDEIPAAIREHDPDLALDLKKLRKVIKLKELWGSVDLVDFWEAKQAFDKELEDLIGEDGPLEGIGGENSMGDALGESEASSDLETFVSGVEAEATEAALQQQAVKAVTVGRKAAVKGHAAFERVYEENQKQLGGHASRNPTAVSLKPPGPLPDGASTRVSTLPGSVRHSDAVVFSPVYGYRWRVVEKDR
ncbi:hypothetical protein [Natrononativus amylolyticus]|uniref:hypothetical protein n=1 Tax=Natrononativus amylolyticus TaxID=2963434 RepID=UPI0020CE79F3|nr:hypothetical protein [Natrononativus amylolyticus]